MQVLALAENVAADAVAAQAGVALSATPFYPGRQAVGIICWSTTQVGAASVNIESAPDDATWTVQMTHNTLISSKRVNVGTDAYMRANCTAAGTAGSKYSAYLMQGV